MGESEPGIPRDKRLYDRLEIREVFVKTAAHGREKLQSAPGLVGTQVREIPSPGEYRAGENIDETLQRNPGDSEKPPPLAQGSGIDPLNGLLPAQSDIPAEIRTIGIGFLRYNQQIDIRTNGEKTVAEASALPGVYTRYEAPLRPGTARFLKVYEIHPVVPEWQIPTIGNDEVYPVEVSGRGEGVEIVVGVEKKFNIDTGFGFETGKNNLADEGLFP
jgi:hypothetical protein